MKFCAACAERGQLLYRRVPLKLALRDAGRARPSRCIDPWAPAALAAVPLEGPANAGF